MSAEYDAALEVKAAIDALDDNGRALATIAKQTPTIRERIATAALAGYLAMYGYDEIECPTPKDAAERAVAYTDALIAELNKEPS